MAWRVLPRSSLPCSVWDAPCCCSGCSGNRSTDAWGEADGDGTGAATAGAVRGVTYVPGDLPPCCAADRKPCNGLPVSIRCACRLLYRDGLSNRDGAPVPPSPEP